MCGSRHTGAYRGDHLCCRIRCEANTRPPPSDGRGCFAMRSPYKGEGIDSWYCRLLLPSQGCATDNTFSDDPRVSTILHAYFTYISMLVVLW